MSSRRRFRADDDRGVVIILMALAMSSLLIVAAIVIDLGFLRGSARIDQSIADLAALAGGEDLENERYVDACEAMIDYLNRNAKDMPAIDAEDFCVDMANTECTDGLLAQAAPTIASGKYTVTIEFPVPDEPGAYPAMGAGIEDGPPCDRMRLTVDSTEPAFFGGVVGTNDFEVTRSATLRAGPGEHSKAPALWLLEPYGCGALSTGGAGTSIVVGDMSAVPPIEGLVTVDSNGKQTNGTGGCSGGATTVDVSQGRVHALPITQPADPDQDIGEIRLFAKSRWATACVIPACDPDDVVGGRLAPTPIHIPRRATRGPVDHRWNCKTGYPAYDVGTTGYPGLEIADCPTAAEVPPYIDMLSTLVGTSGAPAGFNTYPRAGVPSDSCNVPTGPTVVLPAGNWFVNCANLTVGGGSSITFSGGNVVTRGGVTSTGTGTIRINNANPSSLLPANCLPPVGGTMCTSSSSNAAWFYMRSGDLDVKGPFFATNTLVHFGDGVIKLTGGGSFTWTAPTEGPFAGLAAWAEKPGAYQVTGGGNVTMAGAFFTPYANAMNISGGGNWDVRGAQFISRRLTASGGANLTMAPNPISALTLPPKEGFLIR
jgi:hypothetical protein